MPDPLRTMKRLLAVLLFGVVCMFAACDNVGECGPFDTQFAVTSGFKSDALQVDPDAEFRVDTELTEIENDTLAAGELVIQIKLDFAVGTAEANTGWPALRLVPAAHACSPPPLQFNEVIQDIRIYSDPVFGEAYGLNDNLAELFDIVGRPAEIEGPFYQRQPLTDFLNTGPSPAGELLLILNEVPAEPTELRFTVEYEQEGEGLEAYTFTTDPIVLESN